MLPQAQLWGPRPERPHRGRGRTQRRPYHARRVRRRVPRARGHALFGDHRRHVMLPKVRAQQIEGVAVATASDASAQLISPRFERGERSAGLLMRDRRSADLISDEAS